MNIKSFGEYVSEKLDIKPADLDNLLLLKKINNPEYKDLLVTGNIAVTNEDVYICIDGNDYDWVRENNKYPMLITPCGRSWRDYESLFVGRYQSNFPYNDNCIGDRDLYDKFKIVAIYTSGIKKRRPADSERPGTCI